MEESGERSYRARQLSVYLGCLPSMYCLRIQEDFNRRFECFEDMENISLHFPIMLTTHLNQDVEITIAESVEDDHTQVSAFMTDLEESCGNESNSTFNRQRVPTTNNNRN
uniref:Uncharacterized protein n=1 Tax=Timema poppense TaxID=170557 RepID=A0A7R9CYY9_TIMPO|nr:unnamed protein product [Timema poppensis]